MAICMELETQAHPARCSKNRKELVVDFAINWELLDSNRAEDAEIDAELAQLKTDLEISL